MKFFKKLALWALLVSVAVPAYSLEVDLAAFAEAERLSCVQIDEKATLVEGLCVSVPGGMMYVGRAENFSGIEADIQMITQKLGNVLARVKPELAPLVSDLSLIYRDFSLNGILRFMVANCALGLLAVRIVSKNAYQDVPGNVSVGVFGWASDGQEKVWVVNLDSFKFMFEKILGQSALDFVAEMQKKTGDASFERFQSLLAKHIPEAAECWKDFYAQAKKINTSLFELGLKPAELVDSCAAYNVAAVKFVQSLGLGNVEELVAACMADEEFVDLMEQLSLKYESNPVGPCLSFASRPFDVSQTAGMAVCFTDEDGNSVALYDVKNNLLYTDLPVLVGILPLQDDCLVGSLQKNDAGEVIGLTIDQFVNVVPMQDSAEFKACVDQKNTSYQSYKNYFDRPRFQAEIPTDVETPTAADKRMFFGDLFTPDKGEPFLLTDIICVPTCADKFVASWKPVFKAEALKESSAS